MIFNNGQFSITDHFFCVYLPERLEDSARRIESARGEEDPTCATALPRVVPIELWQSLKLCRNLKPIDFDDK
ncbi:MAG: hypothetical protein MUE85_19430 [Microscillaceae bacterium]|nr:hypothetical protein [Microscillaceae bacterium]